MNAIKVDFEYDGEISHGTEQSAGYDIHANRDIRIVPGFNKIDLGLKVKIPIGYWLALAFEKSSIAAKHQCIITAGVIDSDYRGEISICIHNTKHCDIWINKGQKFVQAIAIERTILLWNRVDKVMSDTERGEGGFGSTGE